MLAVRQGPFLLRGPDSDERLTRPMIRQGGEWQEVDWQTALEFVANGLRDRPRTRCAASVGALAVAAFHARRTPPRAKLMRGLGSENIDSRPRQCDFSADANRSGAPWLGMPVAGVADLSRLLVIGSFLRRTTRCSPSAFARPPSADCA